MAVKISQLPASSPNGSLVLPVSDGITTGKVTVSQVCGIVTAGQITTSLGYTPYNSTNPNNYISNGVDILASGNMPSNPSGGVEYSSFTIVLGATGVLAKYKILKLSLRNVGFTAANTRIQLLDPITGQPGLSPYISHNNGSASTGVWVDCTINLVGGTLMSVSENSGQQFDANGSYVFMKAHNYTQTGTTSPYLTLNTHAITNFFDGGSYTVLGLK